MTPIPPAQPGEVGTVINRIYRGEARVLERSSGLPVASQLLAGVGTGLGATWPDSRPGAARLG